MDARSFCFTINNYEENIKELIEEWDCRYVIGGYEIGENGTKHIQGYIEFNKNRKLGGLKKLHKKAHWEKRQGSRDEARNYCKKDKNYFEFGNWNKGGQGKRNDINKIVELMKTGTRANHIIMEYPETASRNLKYIDRVQEIVDKENASEFRKVKTIALIGDAGVGKTKWVYDHNKSDEVFTVNPEDNFPFNGYDGEKTILIDDFYGNMKYGQLLRVLDGHKLRIDIKGGHRYAMWTKIYITSNKDPEEWYRHGMTEALKRRLTKVTKWPGNTKSGHLKKDFDNVNNTENVN